MPTLKAYILLTDTSTPTTARRTGLYQLRYTASKNAAPDDGLKSPKHVERLMINKDSL